VDQRVATEPSVTTIFVFLAPNFLLSKECNCPGSRFLSFNFSSHANKITMPFNEAAMSTPSGKSGFGWLVGCLTAVNTERSICAKCGEGNWLKSAKDGQRDAMHITLCYTITM